MGCINDPLWVSNSSSPEIPFSPLSECGVSTPTLLVLLDSQFPSRMRILEDLVLSGLLSSWDLGTARPRPHPSKGTLEEVPDLGGVN